MGQTVHSLTSSIMEKPHTGLDGCLRMLLSCFRKILSVPVAGVAECEFLVHPREVVPQDGPEGHCGDCGTEGLSLPLTKSPKLDKYSVFLYSVYITFLTRL